MRPEVSLPVLLIGVVGLALLAAGVVYLAVECQSLPSFMGPVHGDTGHRTYAGIAGLALGAAALIVAGHTAIRRRAHT
jgi:hypothetical protein